MDSYTARPRYVPRRPAAVQKRRRTAQPKGWLKRLIVLQTFICIILLLMVVIIKGIHVSATDFLSQQVDYVLGHNVEPNSIVSYVGNLAADVRNSIAPGSVEKSGDEGILAAEGRQAVDGENAAGDKSADTSIEFSKDTGETAGSAGETAGLTGDAAIDGSLGGGSVNSPEADRTPDVSGISDGETIDGTSVNGSSVNGASVSGSSVNGADTSGNSTDSTAYEADSSIGDAVSHPQTSVLAASSDEMAQELPEMTAPAYGPVDTPFGSISGRKGNEHNGIDVGLKPGSSVVAAADGEVTEAGISPEYGAFIRIVHKDGWQTVYAGCSNFTVQKGAKINKGDVVARIGNSAISVGYHLHFEIWKDGKPVNPLEYISVDAY